MWSRIIDTWKRFWTALGRVFVFPSESVTDVTSIQAVPDADGFRGPDLGTNVKTEGIKPDEPDVGAQIAKAIWMEELKDLTLEELDQLAAEFYKDDPDVEIVSQSTDQEAGDMHGENSEEEMMGTYDPNTIYEDDGQLPEGLK